MCPNSTPKENLWDEIREKIFKNYALKSIDAVHRKLEEAILYIERNPAILLFTPKDAARRERRVLDMKEVQTYFAVLDQRERQHLRKHVLAPVGDARDRPAALGARPALIQL